MSHLPTAPQPLTEEIRAGNCVAFVGAGFSAPVIPGWISLLRGLADAVPAGAPRDRALRLLDAPHPAPHDLEAVAQLLQDTVGSDRFTDALREAMADPPSTPLMDERLRLLTRIPFRAILTTNFDGLLPGALPGREAYLSVLRPREHRWWDARFWRGPHVGPRVVKLHGDLAQGDVVFTRRDYRRRLYDSPGYTAFLRSVFATTTVLYLGFSFTDAYLNELRNETLALLEYRGGDRPIAFAVINDADPEQARYFKRHEGVQVLTYDTGGGVDFSGFDGWLRAVHDATAPPHLLGRRLSGKRLLWLDAQPRNNDYGMAFLRRAADSAAGGVEIQRAHTWQEALARLETAVSEARPFDLLISHFGYRKARDADGGRCAVAARALREIRARALEVPAIIFSTADYAEQNKRTVTRLGALAYTFSWSTLFREIDRLFEDGHRTG